MEFIVVTSSYRQARCQVLVESLRSVHPDAGIRELWCDARILRRHGPEVIDPSALDLGPWRWVDLVLAMGERVAGWAIVPWVAETLGTARPLVVLDDSFLALGRLDDLVQGGPDETVLRASKVDPSTGAVWGGALPGFVSFCGDSRTDVQWWADRVPDALADPELAHSGAPWWCSRSTATLVADPSFRLGTSLEQPIALEVAGDTVVTEDGEPIRLVDFASFDPREPWWFGRSPDEPVPVWGGSQGLQWLCRTYAASLRSEGWQPRDEDEPGMVPGLRVSAGLRRWFRRELLATTPERRLPNPLVPGEVTPFLRRLAGPGRPDGSGVSVHADQVLDERRDVSAAFAAPRWRDRQGLLHWLWTSGLQERESSLLTLPPPVLREWDAPADGRRPFGVNLVGYLGAELGLGVAARQLRRALESAGVPVATVSYDRTTSNLRSAAPGDASGPYHFNVMVIVPDQLQLFVDDVGPGFLEGRHNIGLWYWECDALTEQQLAAFELVDEVWAPTTYLREVFAKQGRAPVSLVPSPLVFEQPDAGPAQRTRLGLDDRFTFLYSFDFLSVAARKNPLGLAEAYCRAFQEDEGTRLVLKSINGHQFPRERARVLDAIAGRSDVDLRDELIPAADRLALVAAADCYVSLHRSEGLGLTMAEAMAVGTPVIATAYSGNLDFMDETSALLVPADIVEVGPGHHYPAEGHWADPDLDAAAAAMRKIQSDAALRGRLVAGGRAALSGFDHERVGRIAAEALLRAWSGASTVGPAQSR